MALQSKYIVEMTVRAGVQDNTLRQLDYAGGARTAVSFGRRYLPVLAALILVALTVLFAVSCKGSTVAFSSNSTVHTLSVEVVDSPPARAQGLMGVESLPEDEGMLFDFQQDVNAAFWMKDTRIPLSIAFIDSNGTVLEIKDMEPFDTTPVRPQEEYRYAIETNQGWFSSHGIEPGYRVSIDI